MANRLCCPDLADRSKYSKLGPDADTDLAPGTDGPSTRRRYHMQSIEIDPEVKRMALAEAAKLYPELADQASHVIARPLAQAFAWQPVWKGSPPPGQEAWEFQNAAIRAFKRLAGVREQCKAGEPSTRGRRSVCDFIA